MDNRTKKLILGATIVCGVIGVYFMKYGNVDKKKDTIYIPKHSYSYEEAMDIINGDGENKDSNIEYYASTLQLMNFDLEDMKKFNRPIILDLGSDDCGPCLTMKADLEEAYEKYKDIALIHFIDVWKYSIDDKGLPIYSLPTQYLFKSNGKPLKIEELDRNRIDTSQFIEYTEKESGKHEITAHIGVLAMEDFDYLIEIMTVE